MTHLKCSVQKPPFKNSVSSILVDIHNNDKNILTYFLMHYFLNGIIKAVSYPLCILTEECSPLFCVCLHLHVTEL